VGLGRFTGGRQLNADPLGGAEMDDLGSILLGILSIVTMIVAPVAWVLILLFACKAIANRKLGLSLWRDAPGFNPFNHLMSRNLTQEGLIYRRRMYLALLAFVIPIVLTVGLASLTGDLG
jgi:ABC-type glycerol-3-phosphate transport system permease component